jgi:hypothetical protein
MNLDDPKRFTIEDDLKGIEERLLSTGEVIAKLNPSHQKAQIIRNLNVGEAAWYDQYHRVKRTA